MAFVIRGLLESAVARARQLEAYEEGAAVTRLAAALSYGLIKNHAFIDGNKRSVSPLLSCSLTSTVCVCLRPRTSELV